MIKIISDKFENVSTNSYTLLLNMKLAFEQYQIDKKVLSNISKY